MALKSDAWAITDENEKEMKALIRQYKRQRARANKANADMKETASQIKALMQEFHAEEFVSIAGSVHYKTDVPAVKLDTKRLKSEHSRLVERYETKYSKEYFRVD